MMTDKDLQKQMLRNS